MDQQSKQQTEKLDITVKFNQAEQDWTYTAKHPNGSVIAFCRDKSRKRAKIVCLSRLLMEYEEYELHLEEEED